ncbi:hypothetical protein AKJ66_04155 [candidate division MSBL1 archaeon SCGC-AAA259E22]|uniref:Metallo-beta-lactamase domain-containing protein n=1 Tax=candidate division MSBL1 archaeon SCGC-AAA259E22 TaxID=1698265 RepID=A0A133UE06_9EURY|nr:hypothetical protein AKJ66_04155 [candidate division MSBL1 archaeon SCGC-AAA259E22]
MLDSYGISPTGIKSKGRVSNHAVLMGENFTCDGHFDRPIRVVTHAHSDHISGLKKSLTECELVIMTPTTQGFLKALYMEKYGDLEGVVALDYGESFQYRGEKITLYDANHIPGSAQVLVETRESDRLLYTGDFKLPGAWIVPADLLIIDSTYGKPSQTRYFQKRMEDIFVEFVKDKLVEESVNIYAYHGKIQEALKILRSNGIKSPAVMPEKIYEATKFCAKKRDIFGHFYSLGSQKGKKTLTKKHIGLFHKRKNAIDNSCFSVRLSGWIFDRPIRYFDKEYKVGLSDHSDFRRLMQYVEESDPKCVITDGSRGGSSKCLAREIRKKFKKSAVSMP